VSGACAVKAAPTIVFGCELEIGVDYYGADFKFLEAPITAEECAKECSETAECSHFTAAWGQCYLKSSGEGAKPNGDAVSGACVGEAAPTIVFGCELEIGVDYYGADFKFLEGPITAEECAKECSETAKCSHFTAAWGMCFLKSSGEGAKAVPEAIGGVCT
jgi:hypothetical protein